MTNPPLPTISVLMAVYNTEFVLVKRAIDSVLRQNFTNFELIVLDDGSHPYLRHQLLAYIQPYPQIKYLRHENRGQSRSINRGVNFCSGTYITIIDADDEYKSQHLSACLNEIKEFDLIASCTETIVNKNEDHYVPDRFDYNKSIHVDDCILFATLFGKKEVFMQLRFKDMYAADADFFERAAEVFKVHKVNLRTYIYYRNMGGSVCDRVKRRHRA